VKIALLHNQITINGATYYIDCITNHRFFQ